MKFTLYFANFTTGEIVTSQRIAKTPRHAENNFRRLLRATGTLSSGDVYRIDIYTDWRDMSNLPDSLWKAPRYTAR